MSRELEESLRLRKVDSAISQAESQLAANDIPGAMNTIKLAQRLDPENKKLNTLMSKVKPLFDRLEKERVSCLDSRERLKEQGDAAFKAANFEAAIVAYTKALDAITDKVKQLLIYMYRPYSHNYPLYSVLRSGLEELCEQGGMLQATLQLRWHYRRLHSRTRAQARRRQVPRPQSTGLRGV